MLGTARTAAGVPLDIYRREMVRRGLAARTISQRLSLLRRFRSSLGRPLTTASDEEIQAWLDSLRVAMPTRSVYIAIFAGFFRWARKAGFVKFDPVEDIVRPRLPRRLPRPMAAKDLGWALEGADARMRCWLLLANYAGLRCCEIAPLRREAIWDDVDPPFLEIVGKGGNERTVPLNPLVEQALREYGLPRSGYVFLSRTRRPYNASTISNYVSTYLHDRGIQATAHPGRHAFATAVYEATGDPRIVQELLGHASLATVMLYTQINPARAVAAVRSLGLSGLGPASFRESRQLVPSDRRDPGQDGG